MLSLILFIPLIGALLAYVLGQRNQQLSGWVASLAALTAFVATVIATAPLLSDPTAYHQEQLWSWIDTGQAKISFSLLFDSLSALMCLIITGVGSLIHFYSIGYMAHDDSRPRYFAYLNLFLFFMLLLVLADNLLLLFAGWEGVGLCSYLLIGFWFKNTEFAKAGEKAFIFNRIGDAGFLVGIFALLKAFGVVDFLSLQTAVLLRPDEFWLTVAGIGLFIGATGKSAQIPLYVWLPDAMAGPTPVSALIHAATMVTAGLYLFGRLGFMFDVLPWVRELVFVVSVVTASLAGLVALFQNDLKKILAYSTVSQLGFMFMSAAAGAYGLALFHVTTHAFFKACLFLSAGNIIHACDGEQDVRRMGGLLRKLPLTGLAYLISLFAIAGIFPLSGYFSKHAIIGVLGEKLGYGCEQLAVLLAALTAVYMARSFALVFLGSYRGTVKHIHAPGLLQNVPVAALAMLALFGGVLNGSLQEFLAPVVGQMGHHGDLHIADALQSSVLPLSFIILTAVMLVVFPGVVSSFRNKLRYLILPAEKRFYVDEAYELIIGRSFKWLARFGKEIIEIRLIDGLVDSLVAAVQVSGLTIRLVHSGRLHQYLAVMLIFVFAAVYFCFLI